MTRPMSPRVMRELAAKEGTCTVCGHPILRGTVCEPCKERAAEAKAAAAKKEADTVSEDRVNDDDWQDVARLVATWQRVQRRNG
jgi:hypothetical protein